MLESLLSPLSLFLAREMVSRQTVGTRMLVGWLVGWVKEREREGDEKRMFQREHPRTFDAKGKSKLSGRERGKNVGHRERGKSKFPPLLLPFSVLFCCHMVAHWTGGLGTLQRAYLCCVCTCVRLFMALQQQHTAPTSTKNGGSEAARPLSSPRPLLFLPQPGLFTYKVSPSHAALFFKARERGHGET